MATCCTPLTKSGELLWTPELVPSLPGPPPPCPTRSHSQMLQPAGSQEDDPQEASGELHAASDHLRQRPTWDRLTFVKPGSYPSCIKRLKLRAILRKPAGEVLAGKIQPIGGGETKKRVGRRGGSQSEASDCKRRQQASCWQTGGKKWIIIPSRAGPDSGETKSLIARYWVGRPGQPLDSHPHGDQSNLNVCIHVN